jgi:hypothetical protein
MTDASSVYAKARGEVAAMLGYTDLDNLSPEASTRLDIATALRVLLDNQSGRLLRGEALDARELLMASDALSKILPSLREPPQPTNREDPREHMLKTYMAMRKRGELFDPTSTYEGRGRRIAELEAKIAELEAALAVSGASSGAPAPVGGANAPAGDNVVTLRPSPTGPDGLVPGAPASDAPAAPPKPEPPPVVARSWDDTAGGRAWHQWRDAGGGLDPWSDNRG